MVRWLRPRTLGIGFAVYFLIVFFAAWSFAGGLPGAWYDAEASRWVYSVFLIAALNVITGLGMVAAGSSVGGHVVLARPDRVTQSRGNPGRGAHTEERLDTDIDHFLESLQEIRVASGEDEDLDDEDLEDEVSEAIEVPPPPEGVAAQSVRAEPLGTVRARRPGAGFLIGPALVALAIIGICGAMLPAAGGVLQTSFTLNTALILMMAYWWPGLGGYFAASVYALLKQ